MKRVVLSLLVAMMLLGAIPAVACNQLCQGLRGPCSTVDWSTGMICNDSDGAGPEPCIESGCYGPGLSGGWIGAGFLGSVLLVVPSEDSGCVSGEKVAQ